MRAIIVLVCCMVLLAGCTCDDPAGPTCVRTVRVQYVLGGQDWGAGSGVNYMIPGGVMASDSPSSFPWFYDCGEVEECQPLELEAWSYSSSSSAYLIVTIYRDGFEYRTAIAFGPYPFVTVAGTS